MKDIVTPAQIPLLNRGYNPLMGAFGKYETEMAACDIVYMCQNKGGWNSFTIADINPKGFSFHTLLIQGWVIKDGETYEVTDEFVARCYLASGDISERIKPSQIDTSRVFRNAFGDNVSDTIAWEIVKLCQRKEEWSVFSYQEIQEFYERMYPGKVFKYSFLVEGGYVKENGDSYEITKYFIRRCYLASKGYLRSDVDS